MATNDAPVLRQNIRWGEEYVSRGLNAKLAGVIKPGVYHGFVLKPGGTMAVLVDHEPDYPRSVAVVERDGYSLTVVMDDPGIVHIPATGTWFVCLEALYTPTQQGYQRIVVREKPEPHHVVLGRVRAGVPLTEPDEGEGDGNDTGETPAPGEAVVITGEMISVEGRDEASSDVATAEAVAAVIAEMEERTNALISTQAELIANLVRLSARVTTLEIFQPNGQQGEGNSTSMLLPDGTVVGPVGVSQDNAASGAAVTLVVEG